MYSKGYKLTSTQAHRIAREGMHSNTSNPNCKGRQKHANNVYMPQARGRGVAYRC